MKFDIRWLLTLTLLIATQLAVGNHRLDWGFFLACVLLGTFAGLTARSQVGSSHAKSALLVCTTSTLVGAIFLAAKFYLHPFVEPSVSFLIADGWRSAGSSFIVGAIAGAIYSLFALMLYAAFSGLFSYLER